MSNQPYEAAQRHPSRKHSPAPSNACESAYQSDKAPRILRVKQLVERTNLSRATLYVLMSSDPTFPPKIKLTARSVGFLESDLDEWIASRAPARNA